MTLPRAARPPFTRRPIVAVLSLALAAALVGVGWFDYVSARREFGVLVRAQAASVRDAVAAAARANRAAGDEAQAELAARLLDNARLIAELDRQGGLSPALLGDIATKNHLFRLTVLAPDGTRERGLAPMRVGPGRGQGGPGWMAGGGTGAGPGGAALVDRLIRHGEAEATADLHAMRRGDAARLAAGVRRHNGGAILVSVDATEVLRLQRQSSLDRLLDDIASNTEGVAYLVFEQGDLRRWRGDLPPDLAAPAATVERAGERELSVGGRPVLEVSGPIDLGGDARASVHLGMRLDGVRRAERRTIVRLATSLGAATLLGVLAVGLVWLSQRYGALSQEHARAQDALRRRDRLAAMGELASTVAHEIRNPLNAIAMSAQRLRRECFDACSDDAAGAREEALALVEVVQSEAQRIDGKVQQFLEFARPPALHRRPTNLGPWLDEIAAGLASYAASRDVRLERHGEIADVEVTIDPEQMRQAVENLLRNAVEATPPGGAVSLGVSTSAREVVLDVADTGAGIAPEHLPKIFDLYFTTKPRGTGVGLAVSQQIVAAHGARLDVHSAPGRGTSMRVTIPAQAGADA